MIRGMKCERCGNERTTRLKPMAGRLVKLCTSCLPDPKPNPRGDEVREAKAINDYWKEREYDAKR